MQDHCQLCSPTAQPFGKLLFVKGSTQGSSSEGILFLDQTGRLQPETALASEF